MARKKNPNPGIKKRDTQSGPRYDVEVYLGRDRDGNKVKVRRTFSTLKKAKAWQGEQRSKKATGRRLIPTTATFGEWLDHWLRQKAAGRAGKKKPRARTMDDYRAHVRRWITNPSKDLPLPPDLLLGRVKLRDLNVDHFDGLYAWMQDERGLSPSSIQGLHRVLRMALKHARKKGKIASNPTDDASVPAPPAQEDPEEEGTVRAMTREGAARFLAAAREERLSAFFHVQLLGGPRPSETFALKWEDVDFDAGTIQIVRSLNRRGIDKDEHPQGWALEPPKTKKSRRTIKLPRAAMQALWAWKEGVQKVERKLVGRDWQDHGFVFTTPYGTPLDLSNVSNGPFRRICAAADLGEWEEAPPKPAGQPGPRKQPRFRPAHRLYDLRHTHATDLLEAGVSLRLVSERLGHASVAITADIYSHVRPAMQDGVVEALEDLYAAAG